MRVGKIYFWFGIESGFDIDQVDRLAKSITDLFANLNKRANKKKIKSQTTGGFGRCYHWQGAGSSGRDLPTGRS